MSKVKIHREEALAALNELAARSARTDFVTFEIIDRRLVMHCLDDQDNMIEAILFEDQNMQAKFRHSETLLGMKNKKRL